MIQSVRYQFKQNIWLLFYLLIVIASTLLGGAIYQKHTNVLNTTKNEQLHLTELYQHGINILFNKYETLHHLIAREYLSNPNFNNETFAAVLKLNPVLIDIWLFSEQGVLQLATLPTIRFPNMLAAQHTRQWFQQALSSDTMVIGRSYFQTSINKRVLPIRSRVTDQQGNAIAVLSTGMDFTLVNKEFADENNSRNTMQITLDNGAFRILRNNIPASQYGNYYDTPLPENSIFNKKISDFKTQLLNNTSATNLQPYIQGVSSDKNDKVLYTLSYNKRYNLWVSAEIPYSLALQSFRQYCIVAGLFYLVMLSSLFLLLRWIDNSEKTKIATLTYKTEHDSLTGLSNRSLLRKYFTKLQRKSVTPLALLYIDLDNFKNINDTFGHSYGDKILIEVGQRLKKATRSNKGIVTRYSGDEFIVFIECSNKDVIAEYSENLLQQLSQPYCIGNNTFQITCSIGISRFPDDAVDLETLLSYADTSMFMAKKRKNNYLFFSKEIHHQLTRNTEIEQQLHGAIAHNEISLVYQPQLNNHNQLVGVEALVRWHNKKLGFVRPDLFIPIAEESGLMPELGLYIMHKAMLEISTLKIEENLDFSLSINVSAKQFMHSNFVRKLLQACIYHAIDKTSITIEITESLFIENLDQLLPIFNEIKDQGISLSLDDFGTGYSSLSMLKKVPIDELKIDKSFVDHITEKHNDKEMLKSIISMGKNLGISVLAEGVETPEQVAILEQANCDLFQGYYFAKPLSLEDLTVFAKNHQPNTFTKHLLYQA